MSRISSILVFTVSDAMSVTCPLTFFDNLQHVLWQEIQKIIIIHDIIVSLNVVKCNLT